jgi:hypothetical protein
VRETDSQERHGSGRRRSCARGARRAA